MNTSTIDGLAESARADTTTPTRLLAVPAALRCFEARHGEGPGTWIRYREHPAYAALVSGAAPITRLGALAVFAKYFALILCKRLISYELIPAHLRNPRSLGGAWRFMRAAARNAAKKLALRTAPPIADANPVAAALAVDGICVAQIDSTHVTRLVSASQPLFDQLRMTRGDHTVGGRQFEESRSCAARTAHGGLFAAVESMLRTSGILDGVSSYLGRQAELVDVNPQINDPSDDFWRRIFSDLPAAPRPASYFHRDASGGDIKAIIYLSDVGAESGPFSYAIGSHRTRGSTLADWIEETNDQSGFSATDLFARRRFAALPVSLRRKCAFGNDLTADQEITARILGAEWVVTAPMGHLVIFDTKGFHRGGMVERGERVVLTCVIGSVGRRPPAPSPDELGATPYARVS